MICYAVLDTAGIVSIEQWAPTQLPNLRLVGQPGPALEVWRGQISGQVDTLRTDLSALADRLGPYALKSERWTSPSSSRSSAARSTSPAPTSITAPTIS